MPCQTVVQSRTWRAEYPARPGLSHYKLRMRFWAIYQNALCLSFPVHKEKIITEPRSNKFYEN